MICVNSVTICPSSLSLKVGETYTSAYALVCPSNASCPCIKWHSSKESVATVDSRGNITAKSVGSAVIYATAQDGSNAYGKCSVNVSAVKVTSITVSPSSVKLSKNSSRQFTATISPKTATNCALSWCSSNPSVASVNAASGLVLANSVGNATIYANATDGSGCQGTAKVTVFAKVSSIDLSSKCLSLKGGESATLTAAVYPSNAENRSVSWSSSNEQVATVKDGKVTAVSKGTAVIYATAQDGSGVRDCCTVTVSTDILVSSIKILPSELELALGESKYLQAIICPVNATNCAMTWSSSNTCVATVNPNSGLVQANCPGEATIYATARDGSGKQGKCVVSVCQYIPVTSVFFNIASRNMHIGDQFTLNATVLPANASKKEIVYSSSDTKVVTVSQTGVVKAIGEGTATIKATSLSNHDKFATCRITVSPQAIIIVPGYMGTELKLTKKSFVSKFIDDLPFLDGYVEEGTKVWPPISGEDMSITEYDDVYKNIWALECDSNGESLFPIAPVEDQKYGSLDTYKTLYERLYDKYSNNWHIEFFGYDWRMSNAVSAAKLDEFITEKGFDSVILIAHSNGGLVASNYLARGANQRLKIKRLITLGTPFKGSLEVLPTLITGELDVPLVQDLSSVVGKILFPILQTIIVNIPSAYEILPPKQFFSESDRSYLVPFNTHLTTYDETKEFLTNNVANWNSALMEHAEEVNDKLWSSDGKAHITRYVDGYYVCGKGKETVIQYFWTNTDSVQLRNEKKKSGDETVLTISSGLDDIYNSRTFYSNDTSHGELLSVEKIWTLIQKLIAGEGSGLELPDGITHIPI